MGHPSVTDWVGVRAIPGLKIETWGPQVREFEKTDFTLFHWRPIEGPEEKRTV